MSTIKLSVLALLLLTFSACKKPTEDIQLVIDTDIIKYTAMINVTDGTNGNAAPSNAVITILGANANDIYELSGEKDIHLNSGMVTIGLHPNVVPKASEPIMVTVEITASGYNKATREVVFTADQKQQVVNISLIRTGSTTPPVVIPPPPVYNTVSLTFTGRCPSRTDIQVRPSVYVYFRKAGTSSAFQYLGYMDKGNISTNLLALNENYEFQIVYGGETYKVSQKIEQTNYNLTIDMPAACKF